MDEPIKNELLEVNIDPKKLFDPKEYITQVVAADEAETAEEEVIEAKEPENGSKSEEQIEQIVSLLTDPIHKDVRHETLTNLKKENKSELLLVAVAKHKNHELQHRLVAACWEAEINYSKYLPFFVLLALDDNYLVSLEAITVISTMEGPFEKKHVVDGIAKCKAKQAELTTEKAVLFNDLIDALKGFEGL